MATIEEVDGALGRYYEELLGQDAEYNKIFASVCEENGIEDDGLKDEIMDQTTDEAILVDFDDNFPLPQNQQFDDDTDKKQYIHEILKKCYINPNRSWKGLNLLPIFNAKLFESIQTKDIEEIKKVYLNQCPSIYYQGLNIDINLLQILAIAYNYKFDYLQHLVDMYNRDRVRVVLRERSAKIWRIQDWISNGKNPHVMALSNLKVPRLAKPKKGEDKTVLASDLVKSAVASFGTRICPKLLFNPMKKIDDHIERTLEYVDLALSQIFNIIKVYDKKKRICPFQYDVVLALGKPIEIKSEEDGNNSDDETENNPDPEKGPYIDHIGDIIAKLENNNLKHHTFDGDDYKSAFRNTFGQLQNQINSEQKQQNDVYPYKSRFISIVDRRKSRKTSQKFKDKIVTYQPPPGKYAEDIPYDVASEWYISASRTCLLPSMQYNEDVAIGKPNPDLVDQKDKKDEKPEKDKIIGANFHCKGGVLTFSFHVKAEDQIKCYLFFNGQIIRFFPDEADVVLPEIFNMDIEENVAFMQSITFQNLIQSIGGRLIDTQYDTLVNMYR